MPSYSSPIGYRLETGLEPDLEHFPANHYRGEGGDQAHTGPSGTFLERGPSRFLRPVAPPRTMPKNWVRPDGRIFEEVCEVLANAPHLDVSDVEVRVQEGEVSLHGTVEDRATKLEIEDLVADVPGVVDVVDLLRPLRREPR